jgi:hypothetical protein
MEREVCQRARAEAALAAAFSDGRRVSPGRTRSPYEAWLDEHDAARRDANARAVVPADRSRLRRLSPDATLMRRRARGELLRITCKRLRCQPHHAEPMVCATEHHTAVA